MVTKVGQPRLSELSTICGCQVLGQLFFFKIKLLKFKIWVILSNVVPWNETFYSTRNGVFI